MFCRKCGKELQDGARFCPSCGAEVAPARQGAQSADGARPAPQPSPLPVAARAGFSGFGTIALIIGGVIAAVVAVVLLIGGGGGGLDGASSASYGGGLGGASSLNGTYSTSDGSFLVTKIEFSPDGTFRAWDSYDDWDEEPREHGTYHGSGGTYTLEFDNLVMQWCTLEARVTGSDSLLVEVITGMANYIWMGATAYFYK